MKTKIFIIEDNEYKYFTTKAVLESQLKMPIDVIDASSGIQAAIKGAEPDLIFYRPHGGVAELLERLSKRETNRRNTEITMLIADELDEHMARWLVDFAASYPRRSARAA